MSPMKFSTGARTDEARVNEVPQSPSRGTRPGERAPVRRTEPADRQDSGEAGEPSSEDPASPSLTGGGLSQEGLSSRLLSANPGVIEEEINWFPEELLRPDHERMNITQLDAAIESVTGGIRWKEGPTMTGLYERLAVTRTTRLPHIDH